MLHFKWHKNNCYPRILNVQHGPMMLRVVQQSERCEDGKVIDNNLLTSPVAIHSMWGQKMQESRA